MIISLLALLIAFGSGYGCGYFYVRSREIDRELKEIAKKTAEEIWFDEYEHNKND
ncbi:MAG: hypothetical protein H3C36_02980 [Chitinophagaceae bacterium]|nr:hypothetical protein [Chitinophagaceae bacterium]